LPKAVAGRAASLALDPSAGDPTAQPPNHPTGPARPGRPAGQRPLAARRRAAQRNFRQTARGMSGFAGRSCS